MSHGTLTETRRMAKKKPGGETPEGEQAFDRVEFQAPPSWVKKLDAAAAALGVSRSAYIRMACNKQMQADRKAEGE